MITGPSSRLASLLLERLLQQREKLIDGNVPLTWRRVLWYCVMLAVTVLIMIQNGV
jgi:hypothetical protein